MAGSRPALAQPSRSIVLSSWTIRAPSWRGVRNGSVSFRERPLPPPLRANTSKPHPARAESAVWLPRGREIVADLRQATIQAEQAFVRQSGTQARVATIRFYVERAMRNIYDEMHEREEAREAWAEHVQRFKEERDG